MRPILVLIAILLAGPAAAGEAETIESRAVALDGDTIRVFTDGGAPVDVRLWGVDAPEMAAENGHGWAARAVLDDFLADYGH